MYEVDFKNRTSYASNYFYCRIQRERLLYVSERYLLAIAKFLANVGLRTGWPVGGRLMLTRRSGSQW